jgi:hypothetical protein
VYVCAVVKGQEECFNHLVPELSAQCDVQETGIQMTAA